MPGVPARLRFKRETSLCLVQACKAEAEMRRIPLKGVVWGKLGKYQGWVQLHLALRKRSAPVAFPCAPFLAAYDTFMCIAILNNPTYAQCRC